jgi:cytochrome P450
MAEVSAFPAQLFQDPYPFYRLLRQAGPVTWLPPFQAWAVTGYEEVLAVLRDHGRFSSERGRARNRLAEQIEDMQRQVGPLARTQTMLNADPPAHTRMRNLVNKAFTPRAVEEMRPRIEAITEQLLDEAPEPGRLDVMADLANALPVIVIAEMLGVDPADRKQFKAWSDGIAGSVGSASLDETRMARVRESSASLGEYFHRVIEERRREPRNDLVSRLIAAEEQGDLLSADELLATCILLLVAGNETTTNLIGNGALALMRNRDQMRLLASDPSLIVTAVEELLRFDSPVQATSRVALRDARIGGQEVKEGDLIITFLGAANRDPAQFPDPDTLDVTRRENRHLSFGQGIHYCVGAPLARAEAQTAINALLRRFPDAEPEVEKPAFKPSFILRGLESLPIRSRVASRS